METCQYCEMYMKPFISNGFATCEFCRQVIAMKKDGVWVKGIKHTEPRNIRVLSLFDGISCAWVALERAGFHIESYLAAEVDKYAIAVAKKNHPDIFHVGDVREYPGYQNFDLIIGGSPCQDLSIAKAGRKGLEGEKSSLFWEYVRILKESKPKWFILENVASMPDADKAIITETLGVEPILINAALVSAQNRKRLFWTNIPGVTQPEDKGIFLKDIILDGHTEDLKALCVTATYHKKNARDFIKKGSGQMIQVGNIGTNAQAHRVYSTEGKSCTLSALGGGQGAKTGLYIVQRGRGKNAGGKHSEKSPTLTCNSFEQNNHLQDGEMLRKLHPIECERLQGLPDGYTEIGFKCSPECHCSIGNDHFQSDFFPISNTQRYKMLGNGFNVDVIAHILSFIPHE